LGAGLEYRFGRIAPVTPANQVVRPHPNGGARASLAECAGTLGKHSSFLHYRLGSRHLHQWVFV